MEQKQNRHGTVEQIRAIWDRWQDTGAQRFDAVSAMDQIGTVLAEEQEREHRLKTIAEDARRDRELRSNGAPV